MSRPRKQIHLAAHFPGINNATFCSDPAAGSHRVQLVRASGPDRRAGVTLRDHLGLELPAVATGVAT